MIKENFDNNGYDYMDLGLPSGTLWATMNVGASNPFDYGLYFKWGETKGYAANQAEPVYTLDNYKLSTNTSDREPFTKYNSENAILKLEDDAAHVNMGGDWHMPSPKQIKELINNTTSEWITLDNVTYMTFTSKNGKSIFIPVAGYTMNSGLVYGNGIEGNLWSSMLSDSHVPNGYTFYFCSGGAELGTDNHNYKFPVRGVIDKKSYNFKEKKNNMKEKLNLVEILKNAPIGTELWSYACGTCYLKEIVEYSDYPIVCKTPTKDGQFQSIAFTKEGKRDTIYPNEQCVLFPSKDNQDWGAFEAKKVKHFEPFQKVLHIDSNNYNKNIWKADLYSHYNKEEDRYYLASGFICRYDEVIPYKGNEDKLGKEVEK